MPYNGMNIDLYLNILKEFQNLITWEKKTKMKWRGPHKVFAQGLINPERPCIYTYKYKYIYIYVYRVSQDWWDPGQRLYEALSTPSFKYMLKYILFIVLYKLLLYSHTLSLIIKLVQTTEYSLIPNSNFTICRRFPPN